MIDASWSNLIKTCYLNINVALLYASLLPPSHFNSLTLSWPPWFDNDWRPLVMDRKPPAEFCGIPPYFFRRHHRAHLLEFGIPGFDLQPIGWGFCFRGRKEFFVACTSLFICLALIHDTQYARLFCIAFYMRDKRLAISMVCFTCFVLRFSILSALPQFVDA